MAGRDTLVDATAANQLNVSITTITPGQAWRRQVRGVYSLAYLHAQVDFLHIKDFEDWIKQDYNAHKHNNGNNGSPTTQPMQPGEFSDAQAKRLLVAAQPLGKIRKGVTGAVRSIEDIDRGNEQELA